MGEEEATMREKLIEAMARGYTGAPFPSKRAIARSAIALDAALDMLETPPPEMVDAALWKHQLEGDKALHRGAAYATFTDMLATLRSPKI